MGLDAGDQGVDVRNKTDRVAAQGRRVIWRTTGPLRVKLRPVGLHRVKTQAHLLVPGHEQGAFGVAALEQQQAGLKLLRQADELLLRSAGRHQGHAVGLHAQASGLVDRCGTAVELPAHPQGRRR